MHVETAGLTVGLNGVSRMGICSDARCYATRYAYAHGATNRIGESHEIVDWALGVGRSAGWVTVVKDTTAAKWTLV